MLEGACWHRGWAFFPPHWRLPGCWACPIPCILIDPHISWIPLSTRVHRTRRMALGPPPGSTLTSLLIKTWASTPLSEQRHDERARTTLYISCSQPAQKAALTSRRESRRSAHLNRSVHIQVVQQWMLHLSQDAAEEKEHLLPHTWRILTARRERSKLSLK